MKLGPNLPDVLVFASYVLTCAGHAAEGIVLSERAMTLSPTYPANYLGQLGNTYRSPAAATTRSRRSRRIAREAPATGWPTSR